MLKEVIYDLDRCIHALLLLLETMNGILSQLQQ